MPLEQTNIFRALHTDRGEYAGPEHGPYFRNVYGKENKR
jgi:hypothetical protein